MNRLGYGGVVFLMFLENVFPPIPSEVVMPLAGFVSSRGEMAFWGVVLAGMTGSVLGALPLYYLGRFVGKQRLIDWTDRHGKWLAVSGHDVERADRWFDRHGGKAVFFCRLVPGVRSLISIPAGIAQMRLPVFLLYTALGTGIWAALLAYAGYWLGTDYQRVEKYVGPVSKMVLVLLVLFVVYWIIRRRRRRRQF